MGWRKGVYQGDDLSEAPEGEEDCEEHLGGLMRCAAQRSVEVLLLL
jgi:hypothetical protein